MLQVVPPQGSKRSTSSGVQSDLSNLLLFPSSRNPALTDEYNGIIVVYAQAWQSTRGRNGSFSKCTLRLVKVSSNLSLSGHQAIISNCLDIDWYM